MKIHNNNWIFQNNVTVASDGNILYGNTNDTVTVFITGNSTSRTIVFEGMDGEGNWWSMPAFKLPNYDLANQTTGNNESWELDLANYVAVKCRVSSVAGGYVRITARVVNKNG